MIFFPTIREEHNYPVSLFPRAAMIFFHVETERNPIGIRNRPPLPPPVLCVQSGKDSIIRAGKRNPTASIRTPLSNVNFLVLERRHFPEVAFRHS